MGCVKTFKNRSQLKFNFDNRQLVFALCDTITETNYVFANKLPEEHSIDFFYKNGMVKDHIYLQQIRLLPLRFVQNKNVPGGNVERVKFGNVTQDTLTFLALLQG